ncbi:YcnI family protein [Streptomyces sp. NPDC047002]|uniref:YcnI family copper-binding membrane protein n=1 Tax=Streptomyces sp. NPDC047002 TaxID=3155475 RepID=UPI00345271D4
MLLLAGPASAHVTVQPHGDAAKGGSAVVDFKVPNERDNATTTKLEVAFPSDHPLASVMPEPVPGWKIDVTTSKLAKPVELHGSKVTEAVSKVTWTAQGDGIPVGQFQLFPVSLSTLPSDADQVTFKALQTYSNKEVVRWIEPQQPGAPEPEDPAPVLKLTAASAADGAAQGGTGHAAAETSAKNARAAGDSGGSDTDTVARVLGIVGIVVGAAGVAYGLFVGRRRTAA